MDLKYDDNIEDIVDCLKQKADRANYKTMLYAADDFDDFIAFPKSIDIVKLEDLPEYDRKWMEEHGVKQLAIMKCGKAFMRHNAVAEEAEALEDMKTAMDAHQLLDVLDKLVGSKTQLRLVTEEGRIAFFATSCKFSEQTENDKLASVLPVFILEGSF